MPNFTEFLSKYFDERVFLSDLNFSRNKKLYFKLLEEIGEYAEIDNEELEKLYRALNNPKNHLFEYLSFFIVTSRSFVNLIMELRKDLKKYSNLIDIRDLILLAIIKCGDYEFYYKILNNSDFLVAREVLPTEEFNINMIFDIDEEKRKTKYTDLLSQLKINGIKKTILLDLFPNLKHYLQEENKGNFSFLLESIIDDKRIANPLLLEYYLNISNNVNINVYINSEKAKIDIKKLSNNTESIEKINEMLKYIIPLEEDLTDIRIIGLNWIKRQIQFLPFLNSKNIVLALSIYTKELLGQDRGFFGLSDKLRAAYTLIDYIIRFKDKEIMSEILKMDNSDSFATTVIFYSISKTKDDFRDLDITQEFKIHLIDLFFNRIANKIGNIPNSIFYEKISDDPIQLYWRWHDCEKYLEEYKLVLLNNSLTLPLKKYLLMIFKIDINNFNSFFNNYIRLGLPTSVQYEQLEQVLEIFEKEDLKQIMNYYKDSDIITNKNNSRYFSILEKWLGISESNKEQ